MKVRSAKCGVRSAECGVQICFLISLLVIAVSVQTDARLFRRVATAEFSRGFQPTEGARIPPRRLATLETWHRTQWLSTRRFAEAKSGVATRRGNLRHAFRGLKPTAKFSRRSATKKVRHSGLNVGQVLNLPYNSASSRAVGQVKNLPHNGVLHIALVSLQGDESQAITNQLRELMKTHLLDADLTQAALRGAGYQGSLNMSGDEARQLGQALGSDFFVVGKVLETRRAADNQQFFNEAAVGLFFVETRTGRLAHFQWLSEKANTEAAARQQLLAALSTAWPACLQALRAAQQNHQAEIESVGNAAPLPEVIRDDELKPSDKLPSFYQRMKPDYTPQAAALNITATVELEAVFQTDGRVGEIEVIRWAGFGLDEISVATVKKMRFRPAQQNEKAVSLRGLVRFNFRRPVERPETNAEEAERLKRSLRNLPVPVRPHP